MKQADKFNPGQWLIENKLTKQSQLNEMPVIRNPSHKKALGILFHPYDSPDDPSIKYDWDKKGMQNLVKSMGYKDYKDVTGEIIHYIYPGQEEDYMNLFTMKSFKEQENNDFLQPEDLTIEMFKKAIENEFPDKGDDDLNDEEYEWNTRDDKTNPKLKELIEKNKDFLINKFGLNKSNVKVLDFTYYDYVGIANPYGGDKGVFFYTLEDWDKIKKSYIENNPTIKIKDIELDGIKLKYYTS